MADGGGARPEFKRGRGFRRLEAVVRAWGAVGRGVALERGAGEEWVIEERMVFRCVLNGRSAVWQRGKKGERGGVRLQEYHAAWDGVMGPGAISGGGATDK
jgi:hypothetical protein